MLPLIENNLEAIAAICRKHQVKRLELFGSAAREMDEAVVTDIDVLVEYETYETAGAFDRWFGLQEELATLLGKDVDLSSVKQLRNPVFISSIDQDRVAVYDAPRSRQAVAGRA